MRTTFFGSLMLATTNALFLAADEMTLTAATGFDEPLSLAQVTGHVRAK